MMTCVKAEQSIQFMVLPPMQYRGPHHLSINSSKGILVNSSAGISITMAYFNCNQLAFSNSAFVGGFPPLLLVLFLLVVAELEVLCLVVVTVPSVTSIPLINSLFSVP